MPGGRIPKTTRNDPGNNPDKGLEGRGQHHAPQPSPTPKPVGPASVAGAEKFEEVSFAAVAANPRSGNSLHAGAPDGGGSGPSFSAQAKSRGIVEQGNLFMSQKGHSPKRSAGTTTPTDRATREKLATAEGG
jgi:hypothetical protein